MALSQRKEPGMEDYGKQTFGLGARPDPKKPQKALQIGDRLADGTVYAGPQKYAAAEEEIVLIDKELQVLLVRKSKAEEVLEERDALIASTQREEPEPEQPVDPIPDTAPKKTRRRKKKVAVDDGDQPNE